jgi:hypothetical protein
MLQTQATEPQHFSWLRELVIPAFFTLLGAVVTYVVTIVRDDREAKRLRGAFLRAVDMELTALSKQLDASFEEVSESLERVKTQGTGPQFAASLRTAVFSGQIGKVRNVDDKLMIEVIHFYSDLGTIQQVFESTNELGKLYNTTDSAIQKPVAGGRLVSSLWVLQAQIKSLGSRIVALRKQIAEEVSAPRLPKLRTK